MNEIFNSSTRDNYKYNSVYKFKMVNTQGYELTWTQTGNPFDHNNEAPGTVSDISAVNFTLPTTEHDGKAEFGGLHVSGESQYAILEGALGHWTRYIIGQLFGGETLMTISTATAQATQSDWVELYAYVSDSGSGDSGSGDSGSGAGSSTPVEYPPPIMSTQIKQNTTPNDLNGIDIVENGYSGHPSAISGGQIIEVEITDSSYGNGIYTLQTSSNSSAGWFHHPWHLINKEETIGYAGYIYHWASGSFYNSDGTVKSNAAEKVPGVKGEWVELTLPDSIVLSSYYLKDRSKSTAREETPTGWKLYGYNGSSYDLLDEQDSNTDFKNNYNITVNVSTTTSYNKYLLIVTEVDHHDWFGLGEFKLFGTSN
jgi:hypothetical protein